MEHIGIIGAMGCEVTLLRSRMTSCEEKTIAGRQFYDGVLAGRRVVLVCSGIGKVNAAMTAQMLVDHFGVDAILNTGIAGGAGPARVRDVVISTEVAYHDMDPRILALGYPHLRSFTADETLCKAAERACEGRVRWHRGLIATGDQFIDNAAVKADIVERLSPFAIEMEGGAIAHVAAANGLPFVIIRSISDNADDDAGMSYDQFEQLAADDAANIVTVMLEQL